MAIPFIGDGRSVAPPMIDQTEFAYGLLEGMSDKALRAPAVAPFFEAMTDEIRRVLEQQGILSQQMHQDWRRMSKDNSEMLEQVRDAVSGATGPGAGAARFSATDRQAHIAQIEGLRLPEAVRESAINLFDALGLYGEEIQQQAIANQSAGRIRGMSDVAQSQIETIIAAAGIDPDIIDRARTAQDGDGRARPAARTGPFDDALETGAVAPGDKPSTEGFAEGRATEESRKADVQARKAARNPGGDDDSGASETRRRIGGAGLAAANTYDEPIGPQPRGPEPDRIDTFREGVERFSDTATYRKGAVEKVRGRLDAYASEWVGDRPARHEVQGRFGPEWAWVDPEAGARYETRANQYGRITEALDDYAGGTGVSGAVAKAVPALGRYAGVAGAVWGGTQLVTNFAESQRAANMPYTQVYGDGQIDAYLQRADEWRFANLETAGVMGTDQARQLYQGVAATGWKGEEREAALDFGLSNYKNFGMDISTSMRFVEMATSQGVESLDEYQKGLAALSEVAKESGESIKAAHEDYVRAIEQANQISSGGDAAEIATMTTAISTAMAHTPLEGVDWGPLLANEQVVSRAALDAGMEYEDFNAAVRAGDTDAISALYTSATTTGVDAVVQKPPSADVQARIDEIMEASGGRPSNEQVLEVAQLLSEDGVYNTRDIVDRFRDFTGLNLTPEQARQLTVRSVMGDTRMDVGAVVEDAAVKLGEAELDLEGLRPGFFSRALTGAGWRGRKEVMDQWGITAQQGGFLGATGLSNARFGDNTITGRGSEDIYASADSYFEMLREGDLDARSGNLESVYRHIGGLEDKDEAAAWGLKRFSTEVDGDVVEFGISDLPEYVEQVEAGQVRVLGPDGKPVALQDVVGYTPDAVREQQRVKVEIEAKGPLADVLRINTLGGDEAETARMNGRPMDAHPTRSRDR